MAIFVSIRVGMLPFKKKLVLKKTKVLHLFDLPGIENKPSMIGDKIFAINAGNRPISIMYLGVAYKKHGNFIRLFDLYEEPKVAVNLSVSMSYEKSYKREELLECCSSLEPETMLYVYAIDSEFDEYKMRYVRVKDL